MDPGRAMVALAVRILAALTLVVGSTSIARADWSEDFDGGFSQSWTFEAVDDVGDPPATGVSEFAVIEAGADDYLRISHSTTAIADGGGGATDGFGFVSEVFTDLTVSADLNVTPGDGQQSVLAVIGRGDPFTGGAYVAGIDFAHSVFAIARNDDFEFFLTILAVDATLVLDPGLRYRAEFDLIGSNLVARLYDSSGTSLLSTINAVDSSYSSGVSGILVETEYDGLDNPVGPIVGTFDNVQSVPEPDTAWMILAGSGLLMLAARKSGRVESRLKQEEECQN
jgi:hypothetical protein